MKNVIGTVLSAVAIIILLFVTPTYYLGIMQMAKSQSAALSYTRDLIDTVIDTRQMTQDMLEDYTLNMSSTTEFYKFTITRKMKCIMPDPVEEGQTYTTYITVDDISNFNQGDRIIINVEPVGSNLYQNLSASLMGMTISSEGFTLVGRVR